MKNDKNNRRTTNPLIRSTCLAVILCPAVSAAAPWEFGVEAELGAIHTDNITLAADGMEESETVYTVIPQFTLQTEGEQTQADIRYRPEAYFYQDFSEEDTVFHVFDATFTTELVRDRLFLYLDGVNYQTSVSPAGELPTSNIPVTGNRIDSRVLEARPSWQQRIGSAELLVEAGYRYLDYDGDMFQSSDERFAGFNLDNFSRQEGLAWGVSYDYRRMDYDRSTPFEYQRAALNLGFWTSSALRLFAAGGAETSFDDILEPNLDEEFWEAGFQYAPDERLNLEIAAGERSYGTSLRADFSYTLRRGTLSLRYDETPTSRADTVLNRRPLVEEDDLDGILNRPGNADRFVRKRGELNTDIELNKSEFSLRLFTESREDRIDDMGTPLPDEQLAGAALRWEWRFGARTSLALGGDLARREVGTEDDDLRRYSVGFDYDVTARTSVSLEGIRSTQEGQAAGQLDYTENQVRLLVGIELR